MRELLTDPANLDLTQKESFLTFTALITGLIHIYVGYSTSYHTLALAGLGFLGGLAIFLTGKFRNLVVAAAIPYTAVQFVFYYQSYGFSFTPVAAIDKLVQSAFILVGLLYLIRAYERSESIESMLKG